VNDFQLPTAVVGAGAVGCYFGGMLARAGVTVTLIGRAAHVDAINRDGLTIDGLYIHERVCVNASTDVAAARGAKLVLFCVKTTDTDTAARAVQPFLAPDAVLISMQNGVDNVERIRAATGIDAVAAAVYVAAAMTAPGQLKHSGRGDLIVGRIGAKDPGAELNSIAALFEHAGVPCRVAADIRPELWTKMLMNCAYNAVSALGRAQYGRIVRDPAARELMRQAIEEAVAVAEAEGVSLSAGTMTDAAFALGEAMSGATSSTAQDLARGKATEIDSLNGYIVRQGLRHGIRTPVNQALHTLVKLLEETVS
jgi:2-dehydropantoate 2-reductase